MTTVIDVPAHEYLAGSQLGVPMVGLPAAPRDSTGSPDIDSLLHKAILQAQANNHPPKTAALEAARALHAATQEWTKLMKGEADK